MRFKSTFDNWINPSIPVEDYVLNAPMSGFVIDKSDEKNGWKRFNTTPDYIRVYDPRGFEFNISTQNLLYILEYAEVGNGKLLSGEFVYAWLGEQGNNVQLLPVASPEYTEALDAWDILCNRQEFTENDFVVGNIYHHKKDGRCVYLGKFPLVKETKKSAHFFAQLADDEKIYCTYPKNPSTLKQFISVESEPASDELMDKCRRALEYSVDYSEQPKSRRDAKNQKEVDEIFVRINYIY